MEQRGNRLVAPRQGSLSEKVYPQRPPPIAPRKQRLPAKGHHQTKYGQSVGELATSENLAVFPRFLSAPGCCLFGTVSVGQNLIP